MSLGEFQRAFADLIASPQRCLAARADPSTAFENYDLSARERTRLHAMVAAEAMSINCTLYRVNRLIPIYGVLPLTCAWLKERLLPELEAFWESSRAATLQFRRESWRLGYWLQQRIADGELAGGPVEDALRFELAAFELQSAESVTTGDDVYPHPRKRLLRFTYDPQLVLDADAAGKLDPEPSDQEEWLLLDACGSELEILRLKPELAHKLAKVDPNLFQR